MPALAAAVPVAGLALLDGGYFATSWGWAALGLSWVATLALVLRDPGRPSVLEAVFLAALAGLAAWMVVSSAWSSASPAILEAERALVYVAGAPALAVTAERESFVQVLGGLAVAIAGIAGYALFTRLFPDLTGAYDPDPAYQLSEPYGYWNALGIVVAIGTLLALGFAIRAGSRPRRALAAAALPVLAATLFFTFSRGSVLALAIGVAAAVALDSRRLALVTNGLVLAPVPGVTVWLCSRSDALSRQGFPLEDAARDGHRLAPAIVVLAALSAALSLAASALAGRVRVGRRARLAYAAVLVVLAVAAVGAVLVRVGGPVALVTRGYTAFNAPPPGRGESARARRSRGRGGPPAPRRCRARSNNRRVARVGSRARGRRRAQRPGRAG